MKEVGMENGKWRIDKGQLTRGVVFSIDNVSCWWGDTTTATDKFSDNKNASVVARLVP